MYTLVYTIDNNSTHETVYVNLTNACTNSCIFCLRTQKDNVCGANMWHDDEYTLEDIIEQFKQYFPVPKEVVFCGYGEPFLRKEMMKSFAKYLKENHPGIKIRVNTNGHANAIYKTNVINEFRGLIDSISISLNASSEEQYDEICKPKIKDAFNEVKEFIKCCVNENIEVTTSVVTNFDKTHFIDINECKKISDELGAKFKNREFITNGY